MGFGQPPSAFDERRLAHLRGSFGPSLQVLADALSLPLDAVEVSGEVATAPRQIDIAAGTLEPGTVAAQRITVSGRRGGRELLRFRANWYCTSELEPAWALQDTGWHVSVQGDTPLEVRIELPIPLDRMAAVAPGLTAHRAVNAVPVVCAAVPGIRTTVDLPQVIAMLGS
jgi:4-hydroxy-tetrahydrodipicolinate reductase